MVSTDLQDTVIEERLARVDEVDLEPVVFTLMHPDHDEPGDDLDSADRDVELYRCFLRLCVLYPEATIVPSRAIDHVWHAHMLDTVKYRVDCDRVFGQPLDHFPYAGLRGEQDQLAWRADFDRTRELFRQHFGAEIGADPAASACAHHGDGADCCTGCVRPSPRRGRPRPYRGVAVA
jgi:hypothetical protein